MSITEVFVMLTEEFAEVVQILSGITKKVQLVTDRQKQMSKKIQNHIKDAEEIITEHQEDRKAS